MTDDENRLSPGKLRALEAWRSGAESARREEARIALLATIQEHGLTRAEIRAYRATPNLSERSARVIDEVVTDIGASTRCDQAA